MMTHQLTDDRPFPRGPLIGAFALVGVTLLLATVSRVSDIGTTRLPDAAPVESRDLRFEDRSEGGIAIRDDATDQVVAVLEPGTNGFIRGVLRGLARERKLNGIGIEPAFRLTRRSDGTLTLADPETNREIGLDAFGHTNAGAFARLLNSGSATP